MFVWYNNSFHLPTSNTVSRGAGVFLLLVSFVNPFQPVIAYAAGNKNSGELIDIGDGRKMFLECRGSGSPKRWLQMMRLSSTRAIATAEAP